MSSADWDRFFEVVDMIADGQRVINYERDAALIVEAASEIKRARLHLPSAEKARP